MSRQRFFTIDEALAPVLEDADEELFGGHGGSAGADDSLHESDIDMMTLLALNVMKLQWRHSSIAHQWYTAQQRLG